MNTKEQNNIHSWNLTPKEAIRIQKDLAPKVITKGKPKRIGLVAGADLAYEKDKDLAFCVIVVFQFPELKIFEKVSHVMEVKFPYIPGLLSFREGPIVMETLKQLQNQVDLILFDGQGIAHPRRLGIASHIGLLLDLPTIGCAKSKLIGEFKEPKQEKGSKEILWDKQGKQLGTVLRTRTNVKPIFVSPGHRFGFEESTEIVMQCVTKYRIPEPTRIADIEVEKLKQSIGKLKNRS